MAVQSRSNIRRVANGQRQLIACILIILLAYGALQLGPFDSLGVTTAIKVELSLLIVYLITTLASAVCLFQLTRLLYGLRTAVLAISVMIYPIVIPICKLIGLTLAMPGILILLAPILNLTLLLSVNLRATATLRETGVDVGFLGVNPADIKMWGGE